MEKIDLNNVIEVKEIKKRIKDTELLLEFFNQIILLANMQNQRFDESTVKTMPIEVHREPDLSDHDSDFDESE
tara:strand:+ start:5951 stop:6169 length:219 start_codon:yes stop_codon:yes gene_type:complete